MIDLLEMLHNGDISLEEAYIIEDETVEKSHRGELSVPWHEELCLDKYEATARAHGAGLDDLVRFRYEAWPHICSKCGEPIDYRDFGWLLTEGSNGRIALVHVSCSDTNHVTDQPGYRG